MTKRSVTFGMEGLYHVAFRLVYTDGATVLLDRDFTEIWKPGQAWSALTAAMRSKMRDAIRHYKEEQAIFTGVPIDAAVSNLNSTVGV